MTLTINHQESLQTLGEKNSVIARILENCCTWHVSAELNDENVTFLASYILKGIITVLEKVLLLRENVKIHYNWIKLCQFRIVLQTF